MCICTCIILCNRLKFILKLLNFQLILFRFEYVKASGTCIVPINLPNGQELDGKLLKHITGTGPVYLRALEEIAIDKKKVMVAHPL